jgi:hypothetical protein
MRQIDRSPRRPTRSVRYDSLSAFYRADSRRVHSRERDVGLWWREDAQDPLHRAAWVTVADGERLEQVLDGWRERCGEPRSLSWLRRRAARPSGRARGAQAELAASLVGAGNTAGRRRLAGVRTT